MASIRVRSIDHFVLNMQTRMPFQYGIASLTALPHLFLRLQLDVDGRTVTGISSDGLPPKWFTKDPSTRFEEDLVSMLEVIRNASDLAVEQETSDSLFHFWHELYQQQSAWGEQRKFPPLLSGLGVSLVERAMIDAFCRAFDLTFFEAVQRNAFGMDLGTLHSHLGQTSPSDFLPSKPARFLAVRHTVGLSDPLTNSDIPEGTFLNDGLPQSLEENIEVYSLNHFKIKLCGNLDRDLDRLNHLAGILENKVGEDYLFTLDGNEQFRNLDSFLEIWNVLDRDPKLASFRKHLDFVEQPFHRKVALDESLVASLKNWTDRPAMLIDESDGELHSAAQALDSGYAGTSFKNCKGVFKGLGNACFLQELQRRNPDFRTILSSEDLANVGPIALLQDLAVVACMGLKHSERNGHHYFRGLSMFSQEVQKQVAAAHSDLYEFNEQGFLTLAVSKGRLCLDSVTGSPFGYGFDFDVTEYIPLDQWSSDSLSTI